MFFKMQPWVGLFFFVLFVYPCLADDSMQESTEPLTLAVFSDSCYACTGLLIGYFEMEDCIIYLPGETPFQCQVSSLLELIVDFSNDGLLLRSGFYQFCAQPIKFYTCGESLVWPENCKTPANACEANIETTALSSTSHELSLSFSPGFFSCASESNSEGFWFAVPIF